MIRTSSASSRAGKRFQPQKYPGARSVHPPAPVARPHPHPHPARGQARLLSCIDPWLIFPCSRSAGPRRTQYPPQQTDERPRHILRLRTFHQLALGSADTSPLPGDAADDEAILNVETDMTCMIDI